MSSQEQQGNSFTFDPEKSVGLEDVGGGDYRLTLALSPAGVPTLILYSPAECQRLKTIPIFETPEHELHGPLPLDFQRRTDSAVASRCGRPTRTGKPCQAKVLAAGVACRWHSDSTGR